MAMLAQPCFMSGPRHLKGRDIVNLVSSRGESHKKAINKFQTMLFCQIALKFLLLSKNAQSNFKNMICRGISFLVRLMPLTAFT